MNSLTSLTVDRLYQLLPESCIEELLRPRYAYAYYDIACCPLVPSREETIRYIEEQVQTLPLEEVMNHLYDLVLPLVESEEAIRENLRKFWIERIRKIPIIGRFSPILYVMMGTHDGIPIITSSEEVLQTYLKDAERLELESNVRIVSFQINNITRERNFF